jgi:hypothetical protein
MVTVEKGVPVKLMGPLFPGHIVKLTGKVDVG